MAQQSLACHGSPNGFVVGYVGQLCVDVDTSNLFANGDGNTAWNQLLQIAGPSTAFTSMVTPASTGSGSGTNPWVVVALSDLQSYLESGVLTPLNTKDLAVGQTDRFTRAMTDVTAIVRATIQSKNGYVVSGTPNSIPPELKAATCCMILLAMSASCPGLTIEKERRTVYENTAKTLALVTSGALRPSMPTDPQAPDVQAMPSAEVVSSRRPEATGWQLRGL